MNDRPAKILLVQPDPDLVELLVASLGRRFDAHITCVASEEGCLDVELFNPHDLVIADVDLQACDGLDFVDQWRTLSNKPIILLSEDAGRDTIIEAMRLGVTDVFVHPFSIAQLLDRCESALREADLARRQMIKYRQMREMVRRVLRERRELNQRMELVCKDLVDSHRRLVNRVLDSEIAASNPSH